MKAKRLTHPSIPLNQLPPIHLILLSHYHEDHFDKLVEDRLRRGKELKNIRYDASYDEICTLVALVSPRAYAILRAEFGGRSLRSMQ